MKIVILSGASSIHTIRWANGLSNAGHDVHVITQHSPCEPLLSSVTLHLFPFRGILGYYLMVPGVKKIIKKIDPDIINAHYASGYATTARLINLRPLMISVWGSDVYDFPNKSRFHKSFVRKNLMSADIVASTSHCMAEQTRSIAPSLNEILITPFGVNLDDYRNSKPIEGNYGDKITIGTVKTMDDKYGIDILINAFHILIKKLNKTHPVISNKLMLRLVGGGPKIEQLKKHAQSLGLTEQVEFIGRVEHRKVPSELSKLDIYVALSRIESFGVAVIEAGAACRAVVVSNTGGLPEVTLDDQTGIIVPNENAQAAADAIERLVLNPTLCITMGINGRKHVFEKYSWNACIDTMLHAYEETIKKSNNIKML